MRATITSAETPEERRLWADYYEATARILEIMRAEGTGGVALSRILTHQALANRAIARIKEIHGIG